MTLPVQLDHSVVGAVVFGAAQFENVVGVAGIPPCSCSFQPAVANHFIGRFDRTGSNVVATAFGCL